MEKVKQKPRIISLYAGPGTGKSTTATAIFSELKQLGINCEYVSEYAKDATWERRGPKVFQAQEYIFGKQHFRMARVAEEVDIIITDSPILLANIYMADDFGMPSLREAIKEAYALYDNLDVFLERNKPYNPKGRNQTFEQAKALDLRIREMLSELSASAVFLPYGQSAIAETIQLAASRWGSEIPALREFIPSVKPVLTSKELPPKGVEVLTEQSKIAVYLEQGWYEVDPSGEARELEVPRWWMFIPTV